MSWARLRLVRSSCDGLAGSHSRSRPRLLSPSVGAVRARGLLWADVVLGLGVAAVAVLGVLVAPDQQVGFRDLDVLAVLLSLTQGLPLVARRRAPVAVLGWSPLPRSDSSRPATRR